MPWPSPWRRPAGPQGAARDGVSLRIASLTIILIAVPRPLPEDKSRNCVPFINQSSSIHQAFIKHSNPHGMAPPGRSLRVAAITPKSAPTSINHSGGKIVFNGGVIRIGFIFNARSWASWPTQPPFVADDRNAARAEGPSRSTADSALVWRCCGLGPGDHDPATSHQPQPGPPVTNAATLPCPSRGGSPVKFH